MMATAPKPKHLTNEYAEQFCDPSVAAAYCNRPQYPAAVFELLATLVQDDHRIVLDLGAGTGDITFGLAELVHRVDAIEPSAAMRAAACAKHSEQASRIRWISETAESFSPDCIYSLAVAAESLHWMEWNVVLPKLARHLAPQAVLAIITPRTLRDVPWNVELRHLVARYSTNRDYVRYDIVQEIAARKLFQETGRNTITSLPLTQSIDRYIESFHSRNGFSRERMSNAAAALFDDELRALVERYSGTGLVTSRVETTVVWGRPGAALSC